MSKGLSLVKTGVAGSSLGLVRSKKEIDPVLKKQFKAI